MMRSLEMPETKTADWGSTKILPLEEKNKRIEG
jgi:hypothetical protein